jgi:hypothetical protein
MQEASMSVRSWVPGWVMPEGRRGVA